MIRSRGKTFYIPSPQHSREPPGISGACQAVTVTDSGEIQDRDERLQYLAQSPGHDVLSLQNEYKVWTASRPAARRVFYIAGGWRFAGCSKAWESRGMDCGRAGFDVRERCHTQVKRRRQSIFEPC
jgi:hypothetical protein